MKNRQIHCSTCNKDFTIELPQSVGVHTIHCPYCSKVVYTITVKARSPQNEEAPPRSEPVSDTDKVAVKVRREEIITNVLLLLLGVIQCVMRYTAIAGVWNIVNAIICLHKLELIAAHNPRAVSYFINRKKWLNAQGVINILFGGVIGIFLVAFEWRVRDYVIENRDAFEK